jgi:RHS repeat-associated protein
MQKTSANGALLETYAYAPFGENVGNDNVHIGFSSEYIDKITEKIYYSFRYLDVNLGRWNTIDPIHELIQRNSYIFVDNNVCNYFDLYGLSQRNIKNQIVIIPIHNNNNKHLKLSYDYYEAYPKYEKCQCEPCEKSYKLYTGNVYLVQYIKENHESKWEVDGKAKWKYKMPDKTIMVPGYVDITPESPKGGEKSIGHPGGIIDMPGVNMPTQRIPSDYHKLFRIEAYCRCQGKSDRFLNFAIEFEVKRPVNSEFTNEVEFEIINKTEISPTNTVFPDKYKKWK